jgi:hypothetical protein
MIFGQVLDPKVLSTGLPPRSSSCVLQLSYFILYFQGIFNMKSTLLWIAASCALRRVSGHATFQDLWVNGVDEIGILFLVLMASY